MNEIWKDIKEYEGLYQISNYGRIRSLKKWDVNNRAYYDSVHTIKPTDNGNGYMIISLKKQGKRKNYYVHRLVATAFVENPNKKSFVNHLDYNKKNNHCENLEWCTQKENVNYSKRNRPHRNNKSHTNTGERYITYRLSNNTYRVIIGKKEYKAQATIEKAIQLRNSILGGGD